MRATLDALYSKRSRAAASSGVGVGINSGVGPCAGIGVSPRRKVGWTEWPEVQVVFTEEGADTAYAGNEVACTLQPDTNKSRAVARTRPKWP